MTLIRVPEKRKRIIALETEGEFAAIMQQADSGPGDQRRRMRGVVFVSDDGVRWEEYQTVCEEWWRPEFQGGMPRMSDEELRAIAAPSGYRYAEFRWASTLEYRRG